MTGRNWPLGLIVVAGQKTDGQSPRCCSQPFSGDSRPSINVADLGPSELSSATTQHRENFPDNVMGRLGTGVLHRYYSFFVDSPFATAVPSRSQP